MAPPRSIHKVLYNEVIAAALTEVSRETFSLPQEAETFYNLGLQAIFSVGTGGTSCKAYVQTSLDGGSTWFDIVCFAFTAAASKVVSVNLGQPIAVVAPTDGTLADNTVLNGILGDRLRVKRISVGAYTGGSNLLITAALR